MVTVDRYHASDTFLVTTTTCLHTIRNYCTYLPSALTYIVLTWRARRREGAIGAGQRRGAAPPSSRPCRAHGQWVSRQMTRATPLVPQGSSHSFRKAAAFLPIPVFSLSLSLSLSLLVCPSPGTLPAPILACRAAPTRQWRGRAARSRAMHGAGRRAGRRPRRCTGGAPCWVRARVRDLIGLGLGLAL